MTITCTLRITNNVQEVMTGNKKTGRISKCDHDPMKKQNWRNGNSTRINN